MCSSDLFWVVDAWETALGRRHRANEVGSGHGGTAGNAALSAWAGILLLVLFAAEGVTVLSVGRLLTWHVAVGALIVPPLLLKIGSTGWRMVSYYAGRAAYVRSGPPPILFRVLGPLVVVTSVILLGSGVVLIVVGQSASRTALVNLGGVRVDWIFIHQASFFAWFGVMTLHVLGRVVPAFQIAGDRLRRPRAIPGLGKRSIALVGTILLGVGCALLLVNAEGSWRPESRFDFQGHERAGAHSALSMLP